MVKFLIKKFRLFFIAVLIVFVILSGCIQPSEESNLPQKGFDIHVDAKHYLKEKRETVHHWCKPVNEDLIQCLLFDSDNSKSNLVGAEIIVSNKIWGDFSDEEKLIWHDHATEIFEAEATLPDMGKEEATKLVESLKQTHGRVVYFWNFPEDKWPTTMPFIDMEKGIGIK